MSSPSDKQKKPETKQSVTTRWNPEELALVREAASKPPQQTLTAFVHEAALERARKKLGALERMRATGNCGDMPSCPSCGNSNAVLHFMQHELPDGAPTEHMCRDCRYVLTQDELEQIRYRK